MRKNQNISTDGFPLRLRQFLDSKFSTREDASQAMRIPISTLYAYIPRKGDPTFPSKNVLLKLADYGCDIHWLITGETPDRSSEDDPPMSFIDALREVVNLLKGFERAANGDRETFERMVNTYLDGLAAQRLLRTSDQSVQLKKILADFGKRDEAFPDGSVGAAQQP